MTQYIVQITLLAENLTYDFRVPDAMQVGVLAKLSGQAFAILTENHYTPSAQPLLYDQTSRELLDCNAIIHQTSVRNGSNLLLY